MPTKYDLFRDQKVRGTAKAGARAAGTFLKQTAKNTATKVLGSGLARVGGPVGLALTPSPLGASDNPTGERPKVDANGQLAVPTHAPAPGGRFDTHGALEDVSRNSLALLQQNPVKSLGQAYGALAQGVDKGSEVTANVARRGGEFVAEQGRRFASGVTGRPVEAFRTPPPQPQPQPQPQAPQSQGQQLPGGVIRKGNSFTNLPEGVNAGGVNAEQRAQVRGAELLPSGHDASLTNSYLRAADIYRSTRENFLRDEQIGRLSPSKQIAARQAQQQIDNNYSIAQGQSAANVFASASKAQGDRAKSVQAQRKENYNTFQEDLKAEKISPIRAMDIWQRNSKEVNAKLAEKAAADGTQYSPISADPSDWSPEQRAIATKFILDYTSGKNAYESSWFKKLFTPTPNYTEQALNRGTFSQLQTRE